MVIDTLEKCELFRGLSTAYLERVAALCRSRTYRRNAIIFKEGDEAAELYVLSSGDIALEVEMRPVPDRPPISAAVEVCTEGDAFGWSALVEPHAYTLSAHCITNCTVLAIKGDMLRKLMAGDTNLAAELLKRLTYLISRRLIETRLRLTSGLGLIMLGRNPGGTE